MLSVSGEPAAGNMTWSWLPGQLERRNLHPPGQLDGSNVSLHDGHRRGVRTHGVFVLNGNSDIRRRLALSAFRTINHRLRKGLRIQMDMVAATLGQRSSGKPIDD